MQAATFGDNMQINSYKEAKDNIGWRTPSSFLTRNLKRIETQAEGNASTEFRGIKGLMICLPAGLLIWCLILYVLF